MRRSIGNVSLALPGALFLAVIIGVLLAGVPATYDAPRAEASADDAHTQALFEAAANQQAASGAIAAHGVQAWHDAGFKGKGVKIGVIDRGFAGMQQHMGTELPVPKGVRCYYPVLDFRITDNFTENISDCENPELGDDSVGAAALEAVYDIAPEAEYYIASVSQDRFYHFDLKGIVQWMNGEGVSVILFTHDGGWSGPGDGTSAYPDSELKTLDSAVSQGMTWISPTSDRALDTWTGFFRDMDGNNVHEFAHGVECNDVALGPNSTFSAQLRWNDEWLKATRDLEVDLVDKADGRSVAFSGRHDDLPFDPNELLTYTTPDTQTSYCLKVILKSQSDTPLIFGIQAYTGHSLAYPSVYGSVTSPAESNNQGMLAVGATAYDNNTEIRPFSGRGPMMNRNTKPDIVGADGAYSAVLGKNWASTAQAAGHVAGLAALVKQDRQNDAPEKIAEYLKEQASSRPAEQGDLRQDPNLNNTWGHGFAMLGDAPAAPPPAIDPLDAAKAYVDEAIRRYREDPEAAKAYYRTVASVDEELGLYLTLLQDGSAVITPILRVLPVQRGSDMTWLTDPTEREFGKELAEVDEDGAVVEYLVTDSTDNFTFRKKTDWAKRADGLVFSAGWIDRQTDVESTLTKRQKAIATVIEGRDRLWATGREAASAHYKTPESIDGEFYLIMAFGGGNIVADATGSVPLGTNIRDMKASDDPALGQKIAAVGNNDGEHLWITHMWHNPVTGREQLRHTYVTRFFGIYLISGHYDDTTPTPPPPLDPLDAAKAYVNEAITRYRANPEEAKAYYNSRDSITEDGLYLTLLRDGSIVVNPVFPGAEGTGLAWRTDALGREFGKQLAEADENGVVVEYLLAIPSDNFTFRTKTAWAIRADGLVFSTGWIDRETDVESALTPRQKAIGAVIKARSRLQSIGARPTVGYYRTPGSIDGEYYVILATSDGNIVADATGNLPLSTNIRDMKASDDPALGQKIAAVDSGTGEWFSHMWLNPMTGQEERRQTYVARFFSFYIISGYYGAEPCVQPAQLTDGSGTHSGSWNESCLSETRPQDTADGGKAGEKYYARFYTFTLDQESDVTITLKSDEDTYLYLLDGHGKSGSVEAENDDVDDDNRDSRIAKRLDAGEYTIEATTYEANTAGNFNMEVDIVAPQPPAKKYKAISSGANHVCAIDMDGSIMCWGDDSHGQVSDRPTGGVFMEITSGDNHTCALRDDGALLCWGSLKVNTE